MKTDIPKARDLLHRAGRICDDWEVRALIHEALSLMTRHVKPNPRTIARKVTPKIIEGVLELKQREPHLTYVEIGNRFQINAGRVSEIVNGQRTVEEPATGGDGLNRKMGI